MKYLASGGKPKNFLEDFISVKFVLKDTQILCCWKKTFTFSPRSNCVSTYNVNGDDNSLTAIHLTVSRKNQLIYKRESPTTQEKPHQ